jgi:hypothetical protein
MSIAVEYNKKIIIITILLQFCHTNANSRVYANNSIRIPLAVERIL